jgi:hypothetical protein
MYCIWKDWDDWGACSKTCGLGGTRKRNRTLTTTMDAPTGDATDLHEIIEANRALRERVKNAQGIGMQHMAFSFAAGFTGFVVLMFAGRVIRHRRSGDAVPTSEQHVPILE